MDTTDNPATSKNRKKILVVCNYYAPENAIAAIRIAKLVKYFYKAGYSVEVLTEKKEHTGFDESLLSDMEGIKVYYVENSKKFKRFIERYNSFIKPHKDKRLSRLDNREKVNPKTGHVEFYPFETAYPIIGSLDYIVGQLRQKDLFRVAKKKFDFSKDYDHLLTSYGDSFCYFFGRYYKNKKDNVKWIFDIRDAIYRYKFIPSLVAWIPKKYERYIWKHADEIVGISQGICKRVPKEYQHKVHFISNGFDGRVDDSHFKNSKYTTLDNKMSFTYTGSMYGGLQNLSKFFEAVAVLQAEGVIDKDKIEFCYAGNAPAFEIFKEQADKSVLGDLCVYKGKLSRGESVNLQLSSDILLMASYDYKDNNGGIITGKIFEYMNSKRPVIAIVTGDIENSEVSQIIKDTGIGICYEASSDKVDFLRLKEYIKKQYDLFCNKEELYFEPNIVEIKKYDYRNISDRYIKLLRKMEG